MRRRPRGRRFERPENNEPRVNRRIRVPRVLVIDEIGTRLGEFMTEDAVRMAEERGLDLVEVAPGARPPVCKIADYGRMKYEKKKRDSAARKKQAQVQMKEIKVRPKTDDHDMSVKVRAARKFLGQGHKVKVTVRFRGRELAHRNIGADQCLAIADAAGELATIESMPRMEGRQMFMILAPTRRPQPKVQDDEDESDEIGEHDMSTEEAEAAAANDGDDESEEIDDIDDDDDEEEDDGEAGDDAADTSEDKAQA